MKLEIKLDIGAALLVLFAYWVMQERRTTGEEPVVTPLEQRAIAGDGKAIAELRQEYLKKGEVSTANYWLYAGALRGNAALVEEYAQRFAAMPEDRQAAQIQGIKTSSASPAQKKALLERLGKN
ncbi:hypothetical protein [Janthinobacterium lividum]|uniref:hypothetical protein n=1 Tax=Janthinobacterium lividum TaxID=29581 RepID=UPI000893E7DE|nr:hypothetical protein [Janthinobacterium lividum]MCC7714917.1 hypothetical protein [Janthinobacterium lividum]OEZ54427.1 hypothetical protein JANLI_38500 [Janthinobacterium lividum]WQE29075.1 hypothetical protein U0004_01225 [Janthinobacterium lividum]STQ94545.1 Uncharacterised protein [Janthinobacterium lividum]